MGSRLAELALRGGFVIFMAAAGWQDARKHSISVGTFAAAGMAGLGLRLWQALSGLSGDYVRALASELGRIGPALLPGAVLLVLAFATREAIGKGDGWFFLVSGIYLGLGNNLLLLAGSLLLCFPVSAFLLVRALHRGQAVSRLRLPFLPFVIPVALGVTFL